MSKYDKHIVEKRSVDAILSHRSDALERFALALDLLNESRELVLQYAPYALSQTDSQVKGFSRTDTERGREIMLEEFTKHVDRGIWRYLGAATGLEQLMDHTARQEWIDNIDTNTPECNIDTLDATFRHLHDNKRLVFNRGLVKAFESLHGRYKTNDSFKIGKRVIVRNAIGYRSPGSEYINDVERVFYVLDGEKPPEYQHSVRSLLIDGKAPCVIETDYMSLRLCVNENVHITFKNMDIVEKANRIIAAYYGETLQSDLKSTGYPAD